MTLAQGRRNTRQTYRQLTARTGHDLRRFHSIQQPGQISKSPADQSTEQVAQRSPEDLQKAATKRTELTAQDHQAEAAQRGAEGAQINQIRSGLNLDQQTEKPPEQQTPEELYQKLLKPKMDSVINAWGFRPVIEECRTALSEATEENRVKTEKSAIKKLLKTLPRVTA